MSTKLNEEFRKECNIPEYYCPFKRSYPVQSYLGFTGVLGIILFGVYFIMFSPRMGMTIKETSKKIAQQVKSLQGEEQQIYKLIADSDGSMFQNDLVQKTNFSKVKVSRILDRLETKGIVERRRRGMSNIIVLRE